MLSLVLYYILSSSIILYYGVGVNRIITLKKKTSAYILSLLKALIITCSTSSVCYLLNYFLLIPLQINEIFPFFTALVFVLISFGLHSLIKTGSFDLAEDYVVPFMIILISLNEGGTILTCLFINISSVFSFYLLLLILISTRRRFNLYQSEKGFKPYYIMLITICILFIAVYSINASWLMLDLNS